MKSESWKDGRVYSSPLWIGYRSGNTVSRAGYSHWRIQNATQNIVHKWINQQHYYTNYEHFGGGIRGRGYGYSGYYNPFSLY